MSLPMLLPEALQTLEDIEGDSGPDPCEQCTGVGRGKTPTQHFTTPNMQRASPAPHLGKVGELALVSCAQESLQAEQLNSATTQAQIGALS